MKVCIFGAGAVGGYLATKLAIAGEVTLSVVARGAHAEAMSRQGIRLRTPSGELVGHPVCVTDTPAQLPQQDIVLVTVKVGAQPAVARAVREMLSPEGCAVFASNGVPWWWKYATDHPASLPLLDPAGELWNTLTPARALGCVVYSANEVVAPGVVRHLGNNRWVLGEPDGTMTPRLAAVAALLSRAGVNAVASADLRTEIWAKLLRNASINSLCALTRLAVDGLAEDPDLLAQAQALIADIEVVARSQGVELGSHVAAAREQLTRGGAEGGAPPVKGLRPSMLQDVLAGRPLEVEAIVGQVQALAREAGVDCPAIDAVLPLLRGLDRGLRVRAG